MRTMLALYLLVFAVAASACFVGAYHARVLSSTDTRHGLIALLLMSGLWALAHIGFLTAPTDWLKIASYQVGIIVGFAAVGAWLYFCSAYAGRREHRDRLLRRAALIVFAIVAVTKLTNPYHEWYYSVVLVSEPFTHLALDHHAIYWVSYGLAYALAAIGFFMLYEAFRRVERGIMPLAVLVGLTALPLIPNLVGQATPLLLDISHEPIGVAAFAVGVLYFFYERFEEVQHMGGSEVPALILDERGRIQNFSRQLTRLYPPLSYVGRSATSLEKAWPEAARALAENAPLSLPANGSERYYRLLHRPIEASAHPAGRVILFADETTSLKLKRNEARLAGIANSIPGILFQFFVAPDGSWDARHVSDRSTEVLGFPFDEPNLFNKFVSCIPESHLSAFQSSVAHAVETGERWRAEFPYVRPDGTRIWLQGMSMPDPSEEGTVFNGVLLDITERKKQEQEREETQHRMELALENTSALLFEFDLDTGEVIRTGAVEELFGLPEKEVPAGDAFFEKVVHPDDAGRLRGFLERLIAGTHRSTRTEFRTHPENGPVRWLEEEVFEVDRSHDDHRRLVGITRDITPRKKYEEGLIEARREAEQMNELKTRFLANMSHEIRTPLTGIIGFAELLSTMNLEDHAREFAGSIYRSGIRLMESLNSVLDLSQLEAGAMNLKRERVAVDEIASGVVDDLQARAKKKEITITLSSPEKPFELKTDRSALQRVLFNLTSNAVKFTQTGGAVELLLRRENHVAILEVVDTGIGIDPDFLPHLFEPFQQESAGLSRTHEGSGLGLAITSQLVALLGGTIDVDSTKGEGTTFTIRLPEKQPVDTRREGAGKRDG